MNNKIEKSKAESIAAQMNCTAEQIRIFREHKKPRLIYRAVAHYRTLSNQLNQFTPKFRQS